MKQLLMCLVGVCLTGSNLAQEIMKEPPAWSYSANIYEVNIRQYTPEGTFAAFSEHLPRLQEMGVDILWLMPVQPIGTERRKGNLGSYYSIRDYTAVNPAFGTAEDFRALVIQAHRLGMKVILDWVANHSAWDHAWVADNPTFYTTNKSGYIVPPVADWSDVADLNYDNDQLRREMTAAMRYWIENFDIDGFRCDVAGMVPDDYWRTTIRELTAVKADLFMLAEAEGPQFHRNGFDMTYGSKLHHEMNKVAAGERSAIDLEAAVMDGLETFPEAAYRMQFITNHDENSWNGIEFDRMGEAALTFFVVAATVPGMPLLYSGQEAGLDKSLRFFDKDTISFEGLPKYAPFYTRMLQLKKTNKSLWNGDWGGSLFTLYLDEQVWVYAREREGHKVLVAVNLSEEPSSIKLDSEALKGRYTNVFTGEKLNLSGKLKTNLAPWEYLVLSQDDSR
jgi:glycosidase